MPVGLLAALVPNARWRAVSFRICRSCSLPAQLEPLGGRCCGHDEDRTRGFVKGLDVHPVAGLQARRGQDFLWKHHLSICRDLVGTVGRLHISILQYVVEFIRGPS